MIIHHATNSAVGSALPRSVFTPVVPLLVLSTQSSVESIPKTSPSRVYQVQKERESDHFSFCLAGARYR